VLEGEVFEFIVLGVGVNLGAEPPVEGAGAVDAEPEVLLGAFLDRFAHHYEPGHPAFAGAVTSYYRDVCASLGLRVRAITVEGAVVEGEAVDVDEHGGLVVRTGGGLETVPVRRGRAPRRRVAGPGAEG
jgi:biotin-(acetyl-CoA carboxylase) ligase